MILLLVMSNKVEKIISFMKASPKNIKFSDLLAVCVYFFGELRKNGTSRFVFKTPWLGDPRVNIQKDSGNKAKAYQVKQVLQALERMKHEQ
ncbi:toxin HicA [Bartonella queenslandensis]|uniref:toxin HicA n=1 Tax=Bartonella queenslandensis TaxID=481138 RepID=UPI0005858352|nr:toxin HicA [Bartonella queenslandensis]